MKTNYIHKLQDENENLKAKLAKKEAMINELRRYLNSGKFHCGDELDGYVNVADVLHRLNN